MAATLCGAATEEVAIATVARVPGLGDKGAEERFQIAAWVGDLYPAEEDFWGSLQPDRVGEHLIGRVTASQPELPVRLLQDATDDQRYLALTVLTRASSHQDHMGAVLRELLTTDLTALGPHAVKVATQANDPTTLLDALQTAALSTNDPKALQPLTDALPHRSTVLAEVSATLTRHLTDLYRQLAEAAPAAYLPNLAVLLNNLSNRLAELGRREESLGLIEKAVAIYRRLAETAPAAYEPALATALNNLSILLTELGREAPAAAVHDELRRLGH